MARFKMNIVDDGQIIVKAKAQNIVEFDNIFKDLKLKYNGRKR